MTAVIVRAAIVLAIILAVVLGVDWALGRMFDQVQDELWQ